VTVRRRRQLLVGSVAVAVLLSACGNLPFENPGASVSVRTGRVMVGPDETPELVGGTVQREVKITIPAGALTNARSSSLSIFTSATSAESFSEIEMVIGHPINEAVTIRKISNPNWNWDFPNA